MEAVSKVVGWQPITAYSLKPGGPAEMTSSIEAPTYDTTVPRINVGQSETKLLLH
jgi:hypothetical protein